MGWETQQEVRLKLSQHQYDLLQILAESTSGEALQVGAICERTGLDQVHVSVAAQTLERDGLISIREELQRELRLGKVGERFLDEGFPERRSLVALLAANGEASIAELGEAPGLDKRTVGESIKYLVAKEWANKTGATLTLTDKGRDDLERVGADEALVAFVARSGEASSLEACEAALGADLDAALRLLAGRRDVIDERSRTQRSLVLTAKGEQAWESGVTPLVEVTQLSSEHLIGGKWRDAEIKAYDVALDVAPHFGGKSHPFRRVLDETRQVFLQMGFSEIDSPHVESAFWDFDALFQPQDHPAREMQDTFYLGAPATCRLPEESLVQEVRETHETGGRSGSIGWQYRWDPSRAAQTVLRTHTTAATIRALAANPQPPSKVFCVGRVFRREAIDYKHLPVFYQVDGIIVDHHASFADLLGTLSAFYKKMGFEKFDFRPAFFPYTEPSVEIFVWMESRKDWVEMGGAGIFRPEVTVPFGCDVPVLAWGLGLERLAMFRFELSDIRQIYQSDIKWLREVPQCR